MLIIWELACEEFASNKLRKNMSRLRPKRISRWRLWEGHRQNCFDYHGTRLRSHHHNRPSIKMEHSFTVALKRKLKAAFGAKSEQVYAASPLLQYINTKTKSAERG